MAWIVRPEYEDKIIADINNLDSDTLKVFLDQHTELMNKYSIEQ